jgi:hypothetical protein
MAVKHHTQRAAAALSPRYSSWHGCQTQPSNVDLQMQNHGQCIFGGTEAVGNQAYVVVAWLRKHVVATDTQPVLTPQVIHLLQDIAAQGVPLTVQTPALLLCHKCFLGNRSFSCTLAIVAVLCTLTTHLCIQFVAADSKAARPVETLVFDQPYAAVLQLFISLQARCSQTLHHTSCCLYTGSCLYTSSCRTPFGTGSCHTHLET